VTPVANGAHRPSLGLILPATLQGELPVETGITSGATQEDAGTLSELCRRVEASGADSVWAVDHLFWPQPINECLTTLAVAAAATKHVTLGSCVLQLPLRQPSAVAKQATALAHLSGGRFVLGLGVGTHGAEYDRAGIDFHQRGRLMDSGIATMRAAWATAAEPAPGYRQIPGSPPVPLWIGGASVAARRRAAAVGDGWVPLFLTADEYGPALDALRHETEQAGRPADAVTPAAVVFVNVGPEGAHDRGARWLSELYDLPEKAFHRHLVAGSAESCAAALMRFAHAGARHIVVMVAGSGALAHFSALRAAWTDDALAAASSAVPVGVA
jgi:alkanesulfonate monooxygenase SsuD/methylene tetrahydromethanopterin reductase-like flavin-dependent oxidoreductase (luciferase family)